MISLRFSIINVDKCIPVVAISFSVYDFNHFSRERKKVPLKGIAFFSFTIKKQKVIILK